MARREREGYYLENFRQRNIGMPGWSWAQGKRNKISLIIILSLIYYTLKLSFKGGLLFFFSFNISLKNLSSSMNEEYGQCVRSIRQDQLMFKTSMLLLIRNDLCMPFLLQNVVYYYSLFLYVHKKSILQATHPFFLFLFLVQN